MNIEAQSVSELVGSIKHTLESSFRVTTVVGELSNLSSSSAGHWYFSLSDETSSISIALFKMDAYKNPFIKSVKNGDQIVVTGPVSVYQKKGTFQLLAKKIIPAGVGNLVRQYEILKQKLMIEGLFEINLKKDIPKFPSRIGVITAPGGAALQDFLNTLKRRSFWGEVVIIPALVQGESSAKSLQAALKKALQIEVLDTIVITRGGGAIEDLWSFNDENLVRDIFDCPIPIISAVGHQVDYTLCDYASDKRMETPTAAAEILSENHKNLFQKLNFIGHRMKNLLYRSHTDIERRLKRLSPINVLHILSFQMSRFKERLSKLSIEGREYELVGIYTKQQQLDDLMARMVSCAESSFLKNSLKMKLLEGKLEGLNPKRVLKRGYTILEDSENNIITNQEKFNKVKSNTSLSIQFHDGLGVVKKE